MRAGPARSPRKAPAVAALDWRDTRHYDRTRLLACRWCGRPTPLRDEQRRPSHKVCAENAAAIVRALDALVGDLSAIRDQVATQDRIGLLDVLQDASAARRNLPHRPP